MHVADIRTYDPLSISELSFWSTTAEEREKVFGVLRAERPLSWHAPMQGGLLVPEVDGVWAATSHELIRAVSLDPATYSSAQGVTMEDMPEDLVEAASSFLGMDDPKHKRIRRLVSSAFTPKRVALIHDQIRAQASAIVDGLIEAGGGNFVELVSKRLPMWTVYEMLGLEESLRKDAAAAAEEMVAWNDEDVANGRQPMELLNGALVTLLSMGMEFAARRRLEPRDDLMTALVNAEIDGTGLTDDEIAAFFVLLSVAGNDTTRNTTTLSIKALSDYPAQRELLLSDFDAHIGTAVEEFIRFASPVMTFRRTVTRDTVLAGHELREGDWVVLVYSSGNRDESVFVNPHELDITRDPNPHQGFGGGGAHYCLGNFVAKMQIREIIDQLLHRAPGLTVGEPEFLQGCLVRSVKSMPCSIN
ncbi:cytochrome P450 [Gordonia polyisoprenivorans]|uniref:cytochrome P450 n=1 Tax=Gordonia polyisoprenivorans TaxID=84595 RepID=UPI001AD757F7|nr:cytochrome P450 [Gordonia polyisoprenivorans]QTI68992.1 cytochrome P450 [Gordonia polyisoprenivorans]